jgi:hypothetical protein
MHRTPNGPQDAAVASGLHDRIAELLAEFAGGRARSDALVEASVACLEAAKCLAGLAGAMPAGADPGQDAVHAVRAAGLAVRSALMGAGGVPRTE